jgi:hypothetical protein
VCTIIAPLEIRRETTKSALSEHRQERKTTHRRKNNQHSIQQANRTDGAGPGRRGMMKTSSLFFKNQCMLPESYEDALKIPKFDGVGIYVHVWSAFEPSTHPSLCD